MDPFSALSGAAAIAQFVDYSIKLLASARDIHRSSAGILREFADLDTTTTRLVGLCNDLDKPLKENTTGRPLSLNDAQIQKISVDCKRIGTELLAILEKLSISRKLGKWKSLKLAITAQLEKGQIERLGSQLQNLRQELVPVLLSSLREQVEAAGEAQLEAHSYGRSIGETFLSYVEESNVWRKDLMQALYTSRTVNRHSDDAAALDEHKVSGINRFSKLVVNQLRFSDMRNREDNIARSHRSTFEWMFQGPRDGHTAWSSFTDWLQSDSDLYWITGKAGSGKSTLMKFLYGDPRTLQLLNTWAAGTRLITASFFFWNSGTDLQMSNPGLLRSLLCQILDSDPSFAVTLFPGEWEMYKILGIEPWAFTLSDLRRAFRELGNACKNNTKLCLFIDGLDEFDGKSQDLIDLLKDVVATPHIKICTASRPWVVFEEEFKTTPKLRLQDLTELDIKLFVGDKFRSHSAFSGIERNEKGFAKDLINNITERASGVFLWVHLVVSSLLEGLTSGDRISDLQLRLDNLPGDLEELFEKILDSIEPAYLPHASKLFQINRASLEPLSLLEFYCADEYDIIAAKTIDFVPMTREEGRYRANTMSRRLNSRCKGLLEVGKERFATDYGRHGMDSMVKMSPNKNSDAPLSERSRVHYLHKTVKDWLEKPSTWERLLAYTSTPFNAELHLSKSFLITLKISRPLVLYQEFWYLVYSSIYFAWIARDFAQVQVLVEELNRTFNLWIDRHREVRGGENYRGPDLDIARKEFLHLAVYCDFDVILKAQLEASCSRASQNTSTDYEGLILWAVTKKEEEHPFSPYNVLSPPRLVELKEAFQKKHRTGPSVRCTTLLLEYGANPNDIFTHDVVHNLLCSIPLARGLLTQEEENTYRNWFLILSGFISHGASFPPEIQDSIESKILHNPIFQTQFGGELEKLRLSFKGSKDQPKRFSMKRMFRQLRMDSKTG